jgi:hypothetical protein
MKTRTDDVGVITETNVSSVAIVIASKMLKVQPKSRHNYLQAENGNYPNSAAPGQTNNNGINNTPTQATVDVNANEKASTQPPQQSSASQQATSAGANTTNSSTNGAPKAQRDRGNRGGGGGGSGAMRNKKVMNPTTENKPTEKIVNGSS